MAPTPGQVNVDENAALEQIYEVRVELAHHSTSNDQIEVACSSETRRTYQKKAVDHESWRRYSRERSFGRRDKFRHGPHLDISVAGVLLTPVFIGASYPGVERKCGTIQ